MSDVQASFGISFADEVSPGSKSAAKSLEGLQGQIKTDTAAIGEMTRALKVMQAGTVVDVQAFKALKQQLADTKIRLSANQASAVNLGQVFGKSGKEATGFGEQIKSALVGAEGPVGSLSSGLAGLAGKLGKAGVVGAVILAVAAFIALGVAIVATTVKLAKFAVAAADARRSENIMLEGMTKVPLWLGLWGQVSKTSGTQIQANIDGIIGSVSQSREEIVGLAQELYVMGVRGKASLKAVADAQAVGGERGKAYAIGLIQWNRLLGKSSEDTAKIIEAKFGGLAASKAAGFGVQMSKLKENIRALFSGVKIEGFLTGLKKVTDLFSQSTVTGRALKQIVEVMLNPLVGKAGQAGDAVKELFRDMVIRIQRTIIWCQELEISFLKIRNRVYDALDYKGGIGTTLAVNALKIALWSLAVPAALIVGALIAVGIGIALAAAPLVTVVAAVYGLVKGFKWLYTTLTGYDWAGFGKWIAQGIADGVTGAAGAVWTAIKNLSAGAVKLLKNVLGIHSPSLVFKAQARFIPAGMAAGIYAGTPMVHQAMRRMALPPANDVGAPPAGVVPEVVQHQASTVTNYNHFEIKSNDPKEVEESIFKALKRLERRTGSG